MSERVSEAELAVLEVLWENAPRTATGVFEAVPRERGWTLPTVKTLLSRLAAKGAIAHQSEGRRFLYFPLLQRSDYAADESRRLVDRLFDGKLNPLVAHFAERDALSADDIAEIERILEALKNG